MANILRKITISNPLINLGLMEEYDEYEATRTDEELATFYHKMLDKSESEKRPMISQMTYAMVAFSTDKNINAQMLIACS